MWDVSKEPRRRSLPTQGNSDCLGVNDVISVGKSLFFFFLNKQKWPSAAWPPLFSKLPFCLLLIFGCKFHHLLNSLPPLLPFPISFVSSPLSAPCASPPVSPPGCLAWLPLHLCRNTWPSPTLSRKALSLPLSLRTFPHKFESSFSWLLTKLQPAEDLGLHSKNYSLLTELNSQAEDAVEIYLINTSTQDTYTYKHSRILFTHTYIYAHTCTHRHTLTHSHHKHTCAHMYIYLHTNTSLHTHMHKCSL